MSKINKIITNYPVELTPEEVENLSLTLSAVRTAGGGGGGEGKIYHGEGFVTVNNTNNAISLTTEANEKLNQPIPTKVSDLTDSADYQTVAEMSDYSTKAVADTLYAPISVTGDVDTLKSSSGDWNKVSEKLDTTAFSTVSGNFLTEVPAGYATETWVENKHYLSAVPDTYYTKSQTSGADQLAAAFGNILDYDVTAAAGIEITTATYNGTTTFGISMTAEPVVTDTNLSGYNGIAAAPDGTKSGWWNVGLTQDMLNVINGKEDILSFSYDGNTITAINTSAVGKEFTGVVTAGSLSGNGTTNSPLGLKTSAEQALSAVANKIDKPSKTTGGHKYVLWDTTDEAFSQFGPVFYQYYAASLADSITSKGSVSTEFDAEGEPNHWTIGLKTSAENALASVSDKFDKPSNLSNGTYSLHVAGGTFSWQNAVDPSTVLYSDEVLGVNGVSANWVGEYFNIGLTNDVYSAIQQISAANDLVGANGISVVTGANNQVIIAPSGISPDKQYAMTTTGWAEVQAGTTFTGVITAGSISGDGLTNPLGLKTSAENALTAVAEKLDIIAASQTYLDKTTYATDSATFVTSSNSTITGTDKYALTTTGWASVETAYLPTSGGTVSGQLVVSGGDNFDTQFLKITRENVNGYARLGLGQYGALALKADDSNNHTTQVNISPNTTNDQLVQVQHNGSTVGYLIPAVTSTTTAGLTNDGILHIILES